MFCNVSSRLSSKHKASMYTPSCEEVAIDIPSKNPSLGYNAEVSVSIEIVIISLFTTFLCRLFRYFSASSGSWIPRVLILDVLVYSPDIYLIISFTALSKESFLLGCNFTAIGLNRAKYLSSTKYPWNSVTLLISATYLQDSFPTKTT